MNNVVEANTLYACYFIVLNKIGYVLKLKVKIVFISSILGDFKYGKHSRCEIEAPVYNLSFPH